MTFALEHMSSQNSGRLSALLLWFAEECPHCLQGCCAHAWHGPPALGTKGWRPPNQPSCARGGGHGGARGGPTARVGRVGCSFLEEPWGTMNAGPSLAAASNFFPDSSLRVFLQPGWSEILGSSSPKSPRDAPDTAPLLHQPPTTQSSAKGTKSSL